MIKKSHFNQSHHLPDTPSEGLLLIRCFQALWLPVTAACWLPPHELVTNGDHPDMIPSGWLAELWFQAELTIKDW